MKPELVKDVEHIPAVTTEERARLGWKLVGSVTTLEVVSNNVSKWLEADAIRSLETIEEEKLYLDMGFDRFVDFLNSDHCRLGKNGYYERRALLQKEGVQMFDLLNGLQISMRKRKQIGHGNIEIEGDSLIIRETEERIALTDRQRLMEVLTLTVDQLIDKTKKLEKGQEDFRKERERRLRAEENEGSGDGGKVTAFQQAHTVAIGGLAALAAELENATEAECLAYADGQITLLAAQFNRLNTVLSGKIGVDSITDIGPGEGNAERLAGLLDD